MNLSRREFRKLVSRALDGIPSSLARYLDNVAIDVASRPDARTCREMGIDDPLELMGLYQGTPLTERGIDDSFALPDRIVIYQESVEAGVASREAIVDEIRTTVLHEIGHHFGLDEDELDALGFG